MEGQMITTTSGTRSTAASPRIPDSTLARYPAAAHLPRPHTAAELARLLQMLNAAGACAIAIGYGRHAASVEAAQALAAAWTGGTGTVLAITDWPVTAASWLRPARRLTASRPDAWVIADTPAGCAQLAARLTGQPDWTPARTLGFASLASSDLIALTGATLNGMTGPTADGGAWRIGRNLLIFNHDQEDGAP
jgi:hypothetical protein